MLKVICLKWGDKYPADYVNRLFNMVKHNLSQPFEFYCMTEDDKGLNSEIGILPLPDLGLRGWWYKLYLFKSEFHKLEGRVLFLDLDVVITGSIESLVALAPINQLSISQDNKAGFYNSSVMIYNIGQHAYIWDSFWAQKDYIIQYYHGDQDWIQQVCLTANIIPKPQVVSFKYDCDSRARFGGGALGKWIRKRGFLKPRKESKVPEGTVVVLFHGKPDPEDVMNDTYDKYRYSPWIKDYWF